MSRDNKRDLKIVRGLTLSWSDKNPLDELPIIDLPKVTHRNSVWRLVAKKLWEKSAARIFNTVYSWKITVFVIFKSTRDRQDMIQKGVFSARYAHAKDSHFINDEIERFIFESKLNNQLVGEQKGTDHKSYGEYIRTDFVAEIVG